MQVRLHQQSDTEKMCDLEELGNGVLRFIHLLVRLEFQDRQSLTKEMFCDGAAS